MAVEDDSDYELMSHKEIERLRRDKRKPGNSEKSDSMESSVERLNASINKLISILEDAQEDIIEEYQESKPMEKLNQVMDQNETIAKAIISMHNTIKKGLNIEDDDDTSKLSSQSSAPNQQQDPSMPPIAQMPQLPNSGANFSRQQQVPMMQQRQQPMQSIQSMQPIQSMQQQPNPAWQQQSIPPLQQQPNPSWPQQMQQRQQFGQAPGYGMQNLPDPNSLEGSSDLPPLDMSNNDLPPLDNTSPAKKKKFLGFI
jgi:hypothetical protein